MMSKWIFTAIVAAFALQRLAELFISRRHVQAILARGGREHGAGHFRAMQLLHGTWLVAMVAEVWLLDRPFYWPLAILAGAAAFAGQSLRYAAILTLGQRWTVRVLTLPGEPPIERGIYRYVRHPNYVGIILEMAGLPLMHTAWLTAVVYSLLNAAMLWTRIRAEERALAEDNQYDDTFAQRPRFLPVGDRRRGE